jgi:tetratricopeptide (TPR) repeat protein
MQVRPLVELRGHRAVRWVVVAASLMLLALATIGWRSRYLGWQLSAARQALAQGKPQEAIAILRAVEAHDSACAEAQFLLGRALRRSGDLESAVRCLDSAAAAGWPARDIRIQKQLLLTQSGAFAEAGDLLQDFLARGGSDDLAEEIYEARAKGYYTSYRLGDALLCLDYWLQWHPQARQARIWRAEIYERTERLQDALRDYRVIVDHDPQDVEARIRLAGVLLPLNNPDAALAEYEKCLVARPSEPGAVLGQLKCLRRLGQLNGVASRLVALLECQLTNSQQGDVLCELGEISLYDQKYEEAVDYLTRARRCDPVNALVCQPLSIAYARLGRKDLAELETTRGEESIARSNRLAEVTRLVCENPRDPELRYEAGMLLTREGLKMEGAAWFRTALECDPGHQKSHAALAEYCGEIGDRQGAQRHRQQARL